MFAAPETYRIDLEPLQQNIDRMAAHLVTTSGWEYPDYFAGPGVTPTVEWGFARGEAATQQVVIGIRFGERLEKIDVLRGDDRGLTRRSRRIRFELGVRFRLLGFLEEIDRAHDSRLLHRFGGGSALHFPNQVQNG